MARYRIQGHDAEWLLQNERTFSDQQVQKARTGGRPRARRQMGDVGAVAPITPVEARAAELFVRSQVEGDAVVEVLAMLGLEGP